MKLIMVCVVLGLFGCSTHNGRAVETEKLVSYRLEAESFKSKAFFEAGRLVPDKEEKDIAVGTGRYANANAVINWLPGNSVEYGLDDVPSSDFQVEKLTFRYICADPKGARISVVVDDKFYFIFALDPTPTWNAFVLGDVPLTCSLRSGSKVVVTNVGTNGMNIDYYEFHGNSSSGDSLLNKTGQKVVSGPGFDSFMGKNGDKITKRIEYCGYPALTDWLEGAGAYWNLAEFPEGTVVKKIKFRYAGAAKNGPLLNIMDGDLVLDTVQLPKTEDWFHFAEYTAEFDPPLKFGKNPRYGLELSSGGSVILESSTLIFELP
jgi:hypothetical protein